MPIRTIALYTIAHNIICLSEDFIKTLGIIFKILKFYVFIFDLYYISIIYDKKWIIKKIS
jgi:hypothetical protein